MSIRNQFEEIEEQNLGWSTYMCFAKLVTGKHFEYDYISRWFSKLVDREDYAHGERAEILEFLYDLSNR